ncbi:odv-e56 [Leucania separata nucleopolyhedrovirus]|uniref:Odv-e56 n=1 Tax=Leucania separata nucleopolyhedrovirus TaxID=1307956 RepID=Q0ILA2_NPVLS|nr:odv-e56 [Leucania separata nucleopolyhedrovirus]AAR28781.1 odv-e56 [Leucania separata nucleopolyhedrovirus]
MSLFRGLRRVNKTYPNQSSFISDNINLVANQTPPGFQSVINAPSSRPIPGTNQVTPGYDLPNNRFVSTAEVNTTMRSGNSREVRDVFGNVSDSQIGGLDPIRRYDNLPDPSIRRQADVKDNIRDTHPKSRARTPEDVDDFLKSQPRLTNHLQTLKTGGTLVLIGAGVVLTFNAVSLVQDVMNALNTTGGSFHYRGSNNGDEIEQCWLQYRSCGVNIVDVPVNMRCATDPLLNDVEQLRAICHNYNYEAEKTVCRQSDPNADPTTPQYVDISELVVNHTLLCVEPYDMADLIGDLGLDWLLNEDGFAAKLKGSSKSIGEALLPLIIAIGVILFIVFIGFVIFKRITAPKIQMQAPPPAPATG